VDTDAADVDGESDGAARGVGDGSDDGTKDAEEGSEAAARDDDGGADPRVNAVGENLFGVVLRVGGIPDDQIESLWKKRGVQAQNNFRRCLWYFYNACSSIGMNPESISSYEQARGALRSAMEMLSKEGKRSARVIGDVKSAVSIMFGYRFSDKPALATERVAKDLLLAYHRQKPTQKKHLELCFTWKELAIGLATLPLPAELDTHELVGKTACIVRGMTGLRTTEIVQLNPEDTDPSPDGEKWSFWVRIKGRLDLERVTIEKNADAHIDPIAHLLQIRTRGRRRTPALRCPSFWLRDDGSLMSAAVIRAESAKTMQAVGIKDTHSYHIKHAAATALVDSGVAEAKIRSFLRHRQSSRVLMENYVDLHNNQECVKVLKGEM
jgi:hypothetical protein